MKKYIAAACVLGGLAVLWLGNWQHSGAQGVGGGDEKVIAQTMAEYASAFNQGNLDKLTSFWTSDAEYISDEGVATKGQKAIGELFKAYLTAHPNNKLALTVGSTRIIGGVVALQDGYAEMKDADGKIEKSPFTAVLVKTTAGWLLSRVRDLPVVENTADVAAKALHDLDWLVGTWVSTETNGAKVEINGRWNKGKKFLILEQHVTVKGEEVISLTQIIGFDPTYEQLRSWVFDSRGGFGEGWWARQGNTWFVEATGTLSDGRTASSTNLYKYQAPSKMEWQTTQREIDGRAVPDMTVHYARK